MDASNSALGNTSKRKMMRMRCTYTLWMAIIVNTALSGQDYIALMSGTFYDSNPTLSFKMDSLIKHQKEVRYKKIRYNGKVNYKGLDFEIFRQDSMEIRKEYDYNGILDLEKITVVKSDTEIVVLEKYFVDDEIYYDSTYKTYLENGLLNECKTYSYVSDTVVQKMLRWYMKTKNEYDSTTGQIIKISDFASFGLIKYYSFSYNNKGQLQKIEVRDSSNNLGRYCLFNYTKRSNHRLYTANWHRSDSTSYSQTIYEEDPINHSNIITMKEFGFMHDEGFLPSRKPYIRTVIYNTKLVNRGRTGKIEYIRVFKDHQLQSIQKHSYDRKGRRTKEEYGANEKDYSSKTNYRYITK